MHYGLSKTRVVFTIHNLEFGAQLIGKAMAYSHKATTVSVYNFLYHLVSLVLNADYDFFSFMQFTYSSLICELVVSLFLICLIKICFKGHLY